MELFKPEQREQLLKNGSNPDSDHKPVVRLFMNNTSCTWLISEMYSDQPGLAFGLCDLGSGCPELGYCFLPEIQEAENLDKGIKLVCDETFIGNFSMLAYVSAARKHQRIVVEDVIVKRYQPKASL